MSQAISTRPGVCGWVVLLLLVPSLVGCGGNRTATVTGTVTYQNKPVTSGAVTFYGEDGRVDSASLDHEGKYTIAKAPVGPVIVTVESTKPTAGRQPKAVGPPGEKSPGHPGEAQKAPEPGKFVAIPEKYKDKDKSGLTYTVTGGKQTFDIKLE